MTSWSGVGILADKRWERGISSGGSDGELGGESADLNGGWGGAREMWPTAREIVRESRALWLEYCYGC